MIQPHPLRFLPILAITAALSACSVPAPEPAPAPSPAPAPTIQPIPAPSTPPSDITWQDWPRTPGDWSYRVDGDATRAIFRRTDRNETAFVIHCSRTNRQITLMQAGTALSPAIMQIKTDMGTRTRDGTVIGGAAPAIAVRVNANDPMLDEIAFTRGKFHVESRGMGPLTLPPWPEISRVIEDCRR